MAIADVAPTVRRLAAPLKRLRLPGAVNKLEKPTRRLDDSGHDGSVKRPPGPYSHLFHLFLCATIALVGGIGSAYLAVDRGRLFNAVELGQWTAYPVAGTPDADPYSAATLARTGQVPLGAGEGLAFFGEYDSEGETLVAACDYTIAGDTPPARLWTLSVTDITGKLIANTAGRQSLDSHAVLRETDGSVTVTAARFARPGNWLPLGNASTIVFVLRLYDTPLTTGSGLADLSMPTIVRGDCQ